VTKSRLGSIHRFRFELETTRREIKEKIQNQFESGPLDQTVKPVEPEPVNLRDIDLQCEREPGRSWQTWRQATSICISRLHMPNELPNLN